MKLTRAGLMVLLGTSACGTSGTAPTTRLHPATRSSQLVVLMLNMTNLAVDWQFFNAQSDSIGAGTIRAGSASWCAKIPVPAAAETGRLFDGLHDLAFRPSRHRYWTIRLRETNAFVQDA